MSCLSESSLYLGWTRWKVKVFFTVLLLQQFLIVAVTHTNPSSLEEIHPSDDRNASLGTDKTQLEAFQLSSLWFLACFERELILDFVIRMQ